MLAFKVMVTVETKLPEVKSTKVDFIPLDPSKLPEYRSRTPSDWHSRINTELNKFNTESKGGRTASNKYRNLQNRYLIAIIQEEERTTKLQTDKSRELRKVFIDINRPLISHIAQRFIDKAYDNGIDKNSIDELKAIFNLQAVKILNTVISKYDEARCYQPSTYIGDSLEKKFKGSFQEFIDEKINSPVSLQHTTSSGSGEEGRELGTRLANPKSPNPITESIRNETINNVRASLDRMEDAVPENWRFPLTPKELLLARFFPEEFPALDQKLKQNGICEQIIQGRVTIAKMLFKREYQQDQ
jgi:hypothetical protein